MRVLAKFFWLSLTILLLSACSGQETKDEGDKGASDGGATTAAASALGVINGVRIDQANSPDSVRTIYFEFDKSNVRAEFMPVIAAHGRLLASDSSKKIQIHGHGDERGSREYNIALGERRAQSVRRLLIGHGASASQIDMVSYGEERPAVLGHNEDAWSKNRRAEVHYQ